MFVEESMPLTEEEKENASKQDELSEVNNEALQNDAQDDSKKKPKEIFKRGVVYLSFIPPGMTPPVLRNLLSKYAPIGRLFLQVVKEKKGKVKKKAQQKNYTEGWVEFLKKRHAKKIAELLNNTKIGGKKKNRFHDYLWNLKYLPRFKWVHLVERLNYESAVLRQRMRNEISQAKKIASHFKDNVDREERIRRKKRQENTSNDTKQEQKEVEVPLRKFPQRKTMKDIKMKKKSQENREDFLKNLFA